MSREEVLEKSITKYATSYYKGNPDISDETFDGLVDELRELNPDNALLHTPGWGYDPGSHKIKHWYNLMIGSLSKYKDGIDTIPDKFTHNYTRVSAKLDGISVVSYFVNGELVQALTRGDGTYGLDVTSKIRKILGEESHRVDYNGPFTGAIRGEVVMPVSVFNGNYDSNLNPRNIAAGIMNRDEDTDLNKLRYVVYKVLATDSCKFKSIVDNDLFLHFNFTYRAPYLYYTDIHSLRTMYDSYKEDYPCDGLVFSNMTPMGEKDVVVDWDEIAYKFEAEKKEVIVTDITWNATRTGRLVPLIWFDPTELSGAMVQKCTGFNAEFIQENNIGVGSKITVCRSNEVIPDLQEVIVATSADLPTVCPKCGTPLRWSGVDLICDAENESQLGYHFISTIAPLDGAGWSLYNALTEEIHSLQDLREYLLWLKQVGASSIVSARLSGDVTQKRAVQILNALLQPVDAVQFLVACNIPGIGWATAKVILDAYPNFIYDFCDLKFHLNDLMKINGIGEAAIDKLNIFSNRIRDLAPLMEIKPYVFEQKETQFKVAITGALSVKRADFDNKLKERGIEQSGNWKEIKYLITNNPDSGSSKMKMAREKGIEIISEEEFTKKYLM